MSAFESIYGLYHYLICSEDDVFFTNSLERLSYHEYLYRRLRQVGYKRIVFFDYQKESHQHKILTFDKLSQVSFQRVNSFSKIDIEDKKALTSAYKEAEEGTSPLNTVKTGEPDAVSRFTEKDLGMALIGSKISGAKLFRYLINNVCAAISDGNIKTAVVIPVALLDTIENEQLKTLLETFNKLRAEANFNNIILFTMAERGDMLKFERYADMLRGFKGACATRESWLSANIEALKAGDTLIEVSQIGQDEVENLLLREKLMGELPGLEYLKIGDAARLITEQCTRGVQNFKHLKSVSNPEKVRQFAPMRMIEYCMRSPLFKEELCRKADTLKDVPGDGKARDCLTLSRFDGVRAERYRVAEDEGEILKELDSLVGMEYLKGQLKVFIKKFERERKRYNDAVLRGEKVPKFPYMNMRFVGPPGTGKTTVANLVGRLLCAKGILYRTEPLCFRAGDIHSQGLCDVVGSEIEKRIEAGLGGVVVIDEFYNFNRAYSGGNQANEAFSAIMSKVDDNKENLCLILAGYKDEMEQMFREFNPGGARRFPYVFEFKPYSTDELLEIAERMAQRDGMRFSESAKLAAKKVIERSKVTCGMGFGNAGFIEDELLPKIDAVYLSRDGEDGVYTREDVASAFSEFTDILEEKSEDEGEILKELDSLVGMEYLKGQLKVFIKKFERERKRYNDAVLRGEKVSKFPYMNMRFVGPPGTGKTTVANLVGRLLCAKGILYRTEPLCFKAGDIHSNGLCDVVGSEIEKRIEAGLGGVVVIDEFYNFNRAYSGGNQANEAFSAIMSKVDDNKENLCLILAGYKDEMEQMFREFNPGGARRFPYVFEFKPYSTDELLEIAERMAQRDGMRFSESAKLAAKKVIERSKVTCGTGFGNAGFIEDELLPKIDAVYLSRDGEDGVYSVEDVMAAFGGMV